MRLNECVISFGELRLLMGSGVIVNHVFLRSPVNHSLCNLQGCRLAVSIVRREEILDRGLHLRFVGLIAPFTLDRLSNSFFCMQVMRQSLLLLPKALIIRDRI